jgi:cysteinyl-tRNA synthetase
MSMDLLGEPFDIHTGGADNVFPHHEAEIAQSEALAGHPVVRYWVHGQFLMLSGNRMAKSAGNFFRITELEEQGYDALAFRYLALQARYRSPLNFSPEGLAGADRALRLLREKVAEWSTGPDGPAADWPERFLAAVNDDLDLPAVMAMVSELTHADLAVGAKARLLVDWDRILGLDLTRPSPAAELPPGAAEILERRRRAREGKDFAESDRLRERLAELGVAVTDTPEGQRWTVVSRPSAQAER